MSYSSGYILFTNLFLLRIVKTLLFLSVITLIPCFILSSCSKEVKPVPPEATITDRALEITERIKDAYTEKDKKRIRDLTTQNGYGDIISLLKEFDSAELYFTPKWVEIKEGIVQIHMAWSGKWKQNKKVINERGLAIFILQREPLRVSKISRDSPFTYPQ